MISKLPNVGTTIFSIMSKMAHDHGAINLSQGFPNFDSDPRLIHLVNEAMKQGYNQYAPMPGDLELRQRIADKTNSLHASNYQAESDITVTAGATQAIFTAIAAIVGKGDEVIIFAPAYDCYEPAVELFGGVNVPIQLEPPFFRPNWQEVANKINSRTKLIIINSPHNPTGTLFSKEDLQRLEDLVVDNDLCLISDEVYEHIVFDGHKHRSAASLPKLANRTFITASFGKTFHNTGWKLGYCIAPAVLMREFRKVHQYNVFSVNHPIQKAMAIYLSNEENYRMLSGFYQQKRDFFLQSISNSRFGIIPSSGTYFQLLDYSSISSEDDISFAERLTKEYKIATIPTSVFNKDRRDFNLLRICFAKTEETLLSAAAILNTI